MRLRALAVAALTTVLAGPLAGGVEPAELSGPLPAGSSPLGSPSDAARPARSTAPVARPVVVLISVDALNPDAIRDLGTRLRAFPRLAREGTGTLNARTAFEITRTLPNHTGMLTGRPLSGPRGHHVSFNVDTGGNLARTNGHYVPGMFDIAHDRGLRTVLLAEKDKFRYLIRSWDAVRGAPDRIGADNGRNKLTAARIARATFLSASLRARLASPSPPALSFLHIVAPDVAGHAHGFMSRRYLDAVVRADSAIQGILDTIAADPTLRARTTVIVTADHGGRGANHGDPARLANQRIPFYVWGAGAAKGRNVYVLNPGRRDPGTGRPGYVGRQPVRNLDAADLALSLLGLPPLPGTQPNGLPVLRARP